MTQTYHQQLHKAGRSIEEADLEKAQALIAAGATIVDVREPVEVAQGVIAGAIHIPLGNLEARIGDEVPAYDQPALVYCAEGQRSRIAAQIMQAIGFARPVSLRPGFNGWQRAGLPWVYPDGIDPSYYTRYSRQILLPEVGIAGQQRLLDGRVLIVGGGGLGSPAALYLAAAGTGTIGIVDDDVVDLSNLQRQVIHTTARIGEPKVDSAVRTVADLNPDIEIVGYDVRLNKENALSILGDFDVVIDGADNFATRYLINDACVLLQTANVHGGVDRFSGQTTIFSLPDGPCYRCLFDEPPPPGTVLNCAEAGVLGVVPGVIGLLQATEAIKLLLGIGSSLIGRLLMFEALAMNFREIAIRKNPDCSMCGLNGPKSLEDITYSEHSCSIPASDLYP